MKVISKQRNSKMCIICGMDNDYGLRAPFYNMEDGSVVSIFRYGETGLRAMWAKELSENTFGVTLSIETKFRKPVPYDSELICRGVVVKNSGNFFTSECTIKDTSGAVLANAEVKYIKLDVSKIAPDANEHEEMCYAIDDGVKEINLN